LPIAVGFGINSAEAVRETVAVADAAVVGSAIVNRITESLDDDNAATAQTVESVLSFVRELASGVQSS
jgi:tryptophan synthase alpha chain